MRQHHGSDVKRRTVYDVITDHILEKLDHGVIPWQRPWADGGPPKNLVSGKPYRGINTFILGCAGFASPGSHFGQCPGPNAATDFGP